MKTAALLVITLLGGEPVNTKVEVSTMEACMEGRASLLEQDPGAKVFCVPRETKSKRMRETFEIFVDLIQRFQKMEMDK